MRNTNRGRKILVISIVIALVAGILGCVAVYMHGKRAAKKNVMVKDGLSAYELAVQYGYGGTVEEWLDSLRGKSAYEIAVENGYSGTEDNWSASLKAAKGKDGVGIKTAAFSKNNELLITLTDSTVLNLGIANGLNGEDGANGKDGVGITAANINADGQLVISFSDGKSVNLDKVVGINGKDGIGVSSSEINASGELVITYTNGQNANLGVVVGAQGVQGAKGDKGDTGATGQNGVSVSKTEINSKGELVVTLSDNTVSNLGVVVGAKGDKGDKGDVGAQGEQGIQGKKGDKGETGAQGIQGEQGISVVGAEINSKGELVLVFSNNQRTNVGNVIGAKGEKGDKGEKGAQGIQGIQGVKGDKGDVGAQGVAGKDGVSVSKTEINNKGELVITLSDNTVSNLGVVIGAKGDKGDKGDTGAQGIQGIQGEKGDKGEKGEDGLGIDTIVIDNGNLKVTLTNGTTLDLGNIQGAKGEKGETGAQGEQGIQGIQGEKGEKGDTGAAGLGVKSTTINGVGELVIVYSDDTEMNLGKVVGVDGAKGDKGDKGEVGATGIGVKSTAVNEAGELVIVYSNDTEVNLGKVVGADGLKGDKGDTGATGVGVKSVKIENNELVIELSDDTVINLGNVKGTKGEKGDKGDTGVGITNVTITAGGNLKITFTSGNTVDLGNVKGADGRGVDEIKIENNILKIKYSDSDTFIELGNVKGDKGETGAQGQKGDKGDPGRGIARTEISGTDLIIHYTDGTKETHDLSGMVGDPNDSALLVYSLLPDGTYGVMAGGMAKYEATIEIPVTYNGVAVTQILSEGFKGLSKLQEIIIPEGVTIIGRNAFYDCIGLDTLEIPTTTTVIEEYAFYNCLSLKSIVFPQNLRTIGACAFYKAGLLNATLNTPSKWHTAAEYTATGTYAGEFKGRIPDGTLDFKNYHAVEVGGTTRFVKFDCDISDSSIAAKALTGEWSDNGIYGEVYWDVKSYNIKITAKYYASDWTFEE